MPVTLPRRSSTSGSGSLYGTTTASRTDSSVIGSNSYSSPSSYLERASSLTKSYSPSVAASKYSPNYSSYLSSYSSYTPRSASTYRSPSSSSGSSYLTGGSASLGTYRNISSYSSNNDTTTSSRYGLNKSKTKASETPKNDGNSRESAKKPPSGSAADKRLSGSYSSSSLARLVATSGLEMYEKYSPAHYKPNCELPRSRSAVTEAAIATADAGDAQSESNATPQVTLERPRSRYSRLYQDTAADAVDYSSYSRPSHRSSGKLTHASSSGGLSNSSSASDVPTYTLRGNRLTVKSKGGDDSEISPRRNGILTESRSGSNLNGLDAISSTHNQLKGLKLSPSTSAPSLHAVESNVSKRDETNSGAEASGNGDISTTATVKLDGAATSPQLGKSNKIRSATTRSVLPPASPSSSRYWDRENGRTSSLSSSTYNHTDDVSKSASDEKSEGLCGLRNIGNTCFMNSVIQCLSHTSELTKFLRTHNGVRTSASKDQQILYEFAKLIREMWTNNVHSVTPMELKRAFSSKHRMYSDYNQQDAQEFLRFFLDSLHSALNSGVKGEHLKIDDNLSDNKKADLTWEWYARHENSLIRDLFVGQLKSTLKCTNCGNTSVTFDPFWDLSVSLPSSTRCKLDACLDMFIREEILDGDEMPTCSKCQTRRKCTKSFSIQRFPKYLVIHLKRFSETRWSKLSNIVEFPTGERELNMAPYGANHNTNIYYSLYGVSNHMGSTAGGHYVALCKHPVSKKWHEFNDNIVSDSLSENHLVSSSAYILFYERA